ncbi:hypothetical protein KQX54_017366 [Cotesia glomerata]|uniref:Uncharacterized protein n=1 Tax=Cotesia glomerata TaxID=32391 RepID=A0AAV7IEL4_COTGL|nr:hypothetical protein KQX54_017366 [Cotesia glomerata]
MVHDLMCLWPECMRGILVGKRTDNGFRKGNSRFADNSGIHWRALGCILQIRSIGMIRGTILPGHLLSPDRNTSMYVVITADIEHITLDIEHRLEAFLLMGSFISPRFWLSRVRDWRIVACLSSMAARQVPWAVIQRKPGKKVRVQGFRRTVCNDCAPGIRHCFLPPHTPPSLSYISPPVMYKVLPSFLLDFEADEITKVSFHSHSQILGSSFLPLTSTTQMRSLKEDFLLKTSAMLYIRQLRRWLFVSHQNVIPFI